MLGSVLLGLVAAIHHFIKRYGTVKANTSLAFLLLTFSLSLFNVLVLRTRVFGEYQHLYQLPLWFTLSFGPLLFYYMKFSLFPAYKVRGTDLKHLILPLIQFALVFFVAMQSVDNQMTTWNNFIRPIYGPIEYSLFLIFFFVYATLSYRYIRYKDARLRKSSFQWEKNRTWGLRKLVSRLTILAFIYSFFAITDFIAFRFFSRDLHQVEGFTLIGDVALTAMLLWLLASTYWKDLTYYFSFNRNKKQPSFEAIEAITTKDKLYRNAKLNPLRLALIFETSITHIKSQIKKNTKDNWKNWLNQKRLDDALQLLSHPKVDEEMAAFIAGFSSRKAFLKERNTQ